MPQMAYKNSLRFGGLRWGGYLTPDLYALVYNATETNPDGLLLLERVDEDNPMMVLKEFYNDVTNHSWPAQSPKVGQVDRFWDVGMFYEFDDMPGIPVFSEENERLMSKPIEIVVGLMERMQRASLKEHTRQVALIKEALQGRRARLRSMEGVSDSEKGKPSIPKDYAIGVGTFHFDLQQPAKPWWRRAWAWVAEAIRI